MTTPRLTSRRALTAAGAVAGYILPKLRPGMAFDAASTVAGVNARNFNQSIEKIIERCKTATSGKLARDASPEELRGLLSSLASPADDDEPANITPSNPSFSDRDRTTTTLSRDAIRRRLTDDKARKAFDDMSDADLQNLIQSLGLGNDADPGPANPDLPRNALDEEDGESHSVLTFLKGRLDAADFQKAQNLVAKIQENPDGDKAEHDKQALLDFLQGKLSEQDLERAAELVSTGSGESEDFPYPSGAPSNDSRRRLAKDARRLAMDARTRATAGADFRKRFPSRSLDAPQSTARPVRDTSAAAETARNAFRAKYPSRVV